MTLHDIDGEELDGNGISDKCPYDVSAEEGTHDMTQHLQWSSTNASTDTCSLYDREDTNCLEQGKLVKGRSLNNEGISIELITFGRGKNMGLS